MQSNFFHSVSTCDHHQLQLLILTTRVDKKGKAEFNHFYLCYGPTDDQRANKNVGPNLAITITILILTKN